MCRVLKLSKSGFYACAHLCDPPPLARHLRRAEHPRRTGRGARHLCRQEARGAADARGEAPWPHGPALRRYDGCGLAADRASDLVDRYAFGKRCREAGVMPSVGSTGDAYDNAMAESFFATALTQPYGEHLAAALSSPSHRQWNPLGVCLESHRRYAPPQRPRNARDLLPPRQLAQKSHIRRTPQHPFLPSSRHVSHSSIFGHDFGRAFYP